MVTEDVALGTKYVQRISGEKQRLKMVQCQSSLVRWTTFFIQG